MMAKKGGERNAKILHDVFLKLACFVSSVTNKMNKRHLYFLNFSKPEKFKYLEKFASSYF